MKAISESKYSGELNAAGQWAIKHWTMPIVNRYLKHTVQTNCQRS